MALSPEERLSLESRIRTELGFGGVLQGIEPYVDFSSLPDFTLDNLDTGTETTSSTAVGAPGLATITLASAAGFAPHVRIHVDVGVQLERITVQSVAGLDITARFELPHSGVYPVAVESGVTRVRYLLEIITRLSDEIKGSSATAGIKRVDEIWFDNAVGGTLRELRTELQAYRCELAQVLRLPMTTRCGGGTMLSTYV